MTSTFKIFLENNANIDNYSLLIALKNKNMDIVKLMLSYDQCLSSEIVKLLVSDFDFNKENIKNIKQYCQIVMECNNTEILEFILKNNNIDQSYFYDFLHKYVYSSENSNVNVILKYNILTHYYTKK